MKKKKKDLYPKSCGLADLLQKRIQKDDFLPWPPKIFFLRALLYGSWSCTKKRGDFLFEPGRVKGGFVFFKAGEPIMEKLSAVTKALALAQERMTTRLIQLAGNYKLFYPWHFSPKLEDLFGSIDLGGFFIARNKTARTISRKEKKFIRKGFGSSFLLISSHLSIGSGFFEWPRPIARQS